MYAREVADKTLSFGVSGKLIMNVLVMYDHQTESLWSQFFGEAVEGELKGARLEPIPALQTDWSTWVELHPDTKVLDKKGLMNIDPYRGYYARGSAGIIGETVEDDQLPTKESVIGIEVDGTARAYAFRLLNEEPVVNDIIQGKAVLVVFDADSATGVVFDRTLDAKELSFQMEERGESGLLMLVDRETGSRWNALTGEAVEGPLAGSGLERFPSHYSFWFAWKDFHPGTEVYGE